MKARENPFRSDALAKLRYRLPEDALERLADRVQHGTCFSEITGPEGTGKTTLMEDLRARLQSRGCPTVWLRLTRDSSPGERRTAVRNLKRMDPEIIALFDGGEVLGRLNWIRLRHFLRRQSIRGVATLHRTRGLPLLHQTTQNLEVAESLVEELVGPEAFRPLRPTVRETFTAHQGNLREVFRACYWVCAKQ